MTAYLAVAQFRKPHGLKGEAVVFPLTDDPETVLVPGRELVVLDPGGEPTSTAYVIRKSRAYHRNWLIQFEGIDDRTTLEAWPKVMLGVPKEELAPPDEEEIYLHEIPGSKVLVGGDVVGTVKDVYDVPAGLLMGVDVGGREILVPFKEPILKRVDRVAREIEIDPPEGLLDL